MQEVAYRHISLFKSVSWMFWRPSRLLPCTGSTCPVPVSALRCSSTSALMCALLSLQPFSVIRAGERSSTHSERCKSMGVSAVSIQDFRHASLRWAFYLLHQLSASKCTSPDTLLYIQKHTAAGFPAVPRHVTVSCATRERELSWSTSF